MSLDSQVYWYRLVYIVKIDYYHLNFPLKTSIICHPRLFLSIHLSLVVAKLFQRISYHRWPFSIAVHYVQCKDFFYGLNIFLELY